MYNKEFCLNPVYSLRRERVWSRIYKGLKSIHKDYAGNIPEKNYSVINEVLRNSTATPSGDNFVNSYKKRQSDVTWMDDNGKKCVIDAECKLDYLTPPVRRHYYSRMNYPRLVNSKQTTIILPDQNSIVENEYVEIRSCLVDRISGVFTLSGRKYENHSYNPDSNSSKSLFPIGSQGFPYTLNRGEYTALGIYIKFNGDNDDVRLQLDRENINESSRQRALLIWLQVESP